MSGKEEDFKVVDKRASSGATDAPKPKSAAGEGFVMKEGKPPAPPQPTQIDFSTLVLSLATVGVRGRLVRALRLDRLPQLYSLLRAVLTFHLVCVSWVFFRAKNVAEAFSLLKSVGTSFLPSLQTLPLSRRELVLSLILIVFLFAMERRPENPVQALVAGRPAWVRWSVAYALVLAILVFGYFTARQFIYFQF